MGCIENDGTRLELSGSCDPAALEDATVTGQAYPADVRHMWSMVRRSVRHSGDIMDDTTETGKQIVRADLALLPPAVSHLFFVLAARKGDDLSSFPRRSFKISNAEFSEHQLTPCETEFTTPTQANVLCFLSKSLGPWIIERVHAPCAGNTSNYDPVFA